jgi:hypothetical protein
MPNDSPMPDAPMSPVMAFVALFDDDYPGLALRADHRPGCRRLRVHGQRRPCEDRQQQQQQELSHIPS